MLASFDRHDWADRTALIFGGERWTYGRMSAEADRIAAGLQSRGIRKGDRVGLYFRNCPELLCSQLACWRIGAVAVPIRRWQPGAMVSSWCELMAVSVLLVEQPLVGNLLPHLAELVSLRAIFATGERSPAPAIRVWSELVANDGRFERIVVGDREPLVVVHTSGTTNRPKASSLDRRAIDAHTRSQLAALPLGEDDVVCVFVDCSHVQGLCVLTIPALSVGASIVLVPEFEPNEILSAMAAHGVSMTASAPGYIQRLIDARRELRQLDLSKLRFVIAGTDKTPEALHQAWRDTFGRIPLIEAYGLTETCGLAFVNSLDDNRQGTVGRPLPGLRARIVDDEGRDLDDGTVGELWLCGELVFAGYLNDEDLTRRILVDGWLRTGDQAVCQDGCYRIVGRKDFMIKRGGVLVSPHEVEAALGRHPAIAEALAAGVASDRWGHEAEAFVVLRENVSLRELRAHAGSMLGEPSQPARYWMVGTIPKTNLGKVDRRGVEQLRRTATLMVD